MRVGVATDCFPDVRFRRCPGSASALLAAFGGGCRDTLAYPPAFAVHPQRPPVGRRTPSEEVIGVGDDRSGTSRAGRPRGASAAEPWQGRWFCDLRAVAAGIGVRRGAE